MGLGVTFIHATASAKLPLTPVDSTGWTALGRLGIGAWYTVIPIFEIGVTTHVGVSAQRPMIEVGARRQLLGRPYTALAIGVNVAF